jgi:hypothetical protein
VTTIPCDHPSAEECHNTTRYPCPAHFGELLSQLMAATVTGDDDAANDALLDLGAHRWVSPTVYTSCAFIQEYAVLPGQDLEQAMAGMQPTLDRKRAAGMTPDQRAAHEAWLFRLGVIARAAVAGDGAMIHDTMLSGVETMGPDAWGSLVASLARAAHDAVHRNRRCIDARTVALFQVLGSQCFNADAFATLSTLVHMADAARTATPVDTARVHQRVLDAPPLQVLQAIGMCGRAIGQLITPDGPVILSTTGSSGAALQANVTGMITWDDASLDASAPGEERCTARAMRVAVAFANGRGPQFLRKVLVDGPDGTGYARDVVLGSAGLLGLMVESRAAEV